MKLAEIVSENYGIPKETMLDLTKFSFGENKELYVENHKGILEYNENIIKIKTKSMSVRIEGADLRFTYINKFDLLVEGVFSRVIFEH